MALLEGKTAVITGGTTGIGLATAKRFVEEGAYVFITGRRQAELETAVKELGDNATGVQGDVSKEEDLDRLYSVVADSGRHIDVVFANAATMDAARLGEITEEHLDYQLDVDFKGVVFTVQKALPLLNDGGSVILNSSNTNAQGSDGIGVYAAIKAALRSFARTWASELRDRRIRVNVVSPGATETPGIESLAQMLFPGPKAAAKFEEYPNQQSCRWRATALRRGGQRGAVSGIGPEQLHHRRRHPRRRRHQPDSECSPTRERVRICTDNHGVSVRQTRRSQRGGVSTAACGSCLRCSTPRAGPESSRSEWPWRAVRRSAGPSGSTSTGPRYPSA